MRRLLLLAAVAWTGCGSTDACDGIGGTCIGLTVKGQIQLDALEVDLSGALSGMSGLAVHASRLPITVALHIGRPVSGALRIAATARFQGVTVGAGTTTINIAAGQHVSASVFVAGVATGGTDGGADLLSGGPDLQSPREQPDLACTSLSDDPLSCGACGHSCLGGACQGGQCQPMVLASGQTGAIGIVADRTDVYWSIETPSHMVSLPLSGGAPMPFPSSPPSAALLALQGTTLYVADPASSAIWMMVLPSTVVISVAAGQSAPIGVTADAQSPANVYWTSTLNGNLSTVKVGGVARVLLKTTQPTGIAVTAGGTDLYWAASTGINHLALSGLPTPTVIVPGQSNAIGVALDEANVYWTTGSGAVMAAALDGSNLRTLAAARSMPTGIFVDATSIYWAESGSGQILRLAK
jgi:hypothetical protein